LTGNIGPVTVTNLRAGLPDKSESLCSALPRTGQDRGIISDSHLNVGRRGSALITAICTISVLAAIVALMVPLALTGARLSTARDDAEHARQMAEGYFEYGLALIYGDTFGDDGVPYNNDRGDEGYDWLDDRFGPYTLCELRDGVVVFNDHTDNGLAAEVRLRIIDHESLANINVHGNFYGPGGTTNVGHGASPAEIALECALASADLPVSIFPDRAEAGEAVRKLARQIISSAHFFNLPGYFPGGERDCIDNHARLDYLSGDANRTGFAEPNGFSRGLNDFADNTPADAAFPSFFTKGPNQTRFGLQTELAIQYARFYPDNPRTPAGRVEDFARDDRAGKLVEKSRLFLHCLRAVDGDELKARALFAAIAERVSTYSGDPDVQGNLGPRVCVNDPSPENLQRVYEILLRCRDIDPPEARQVVANLRAYLSEGGSSPAGENDLSFMGAVGLSRFPRFSEVFFVAQKKTLYIEAANPFLTAPAADGEEDVSIDMRNFELRVKLKGREETFTADLDCDGSVIGRGEPDDGRKVVVYRIGSGSKSIIPLVLVPAVQIDAPSDIESIELWYRPGVGNPFPDGPIDRIPAFVFENCTSKSNERIDLLASSTDSENWAPSTVSRGHSLRGFSSGGEKSFNSVSVMECDAAGAPYLDIGGDGNRFAGVGEFFKLLAIGPSYNPETGKPFESMAQFVGYLGSHREDAKLYERLGSEDRARLYDALTTFSPLPADYVNGEDRNVREGRININTALRGTLVALPFVAEEADANNIGVDALIYEFQKDEPAGSRSDLLRLPSLNPRVSPLIPQNRFPKNFADNPMARDRANHPEEREFVLGVLENMVTARSNVFTIFVEVELKTSRGTVAVARLVGVADRSRPADPGAQTFHPRIRVILRHFLEK